MCRQMGKSHGSRGASHGMKSQSSGSSYWGAVRALFSGATLGIDLRRLPFSPLSPSRPPPSRGSRVSPAASSPLASAASSSCSTSFRRCSSRRGSSPTSDAKLLPNFPPFAGENMGYTTEYILHKWEAGA